MSTPQPAPSGPPLRALAMVLIALAIAFAGIGAMTLSNSGSDPQSADVVVPNVAPVSAAPNSPAASVRPTTTTPAPAPTAASAAPQAAAVDRSSVQVRVFNNSTVSGLAAETATTLESNGWSVAETGNYSTGTVPKSAVYYTATSASEKRAAQQIADELGITAEPRFAGIAASSPGVIVIITS